MCLVCIDSRHVNLLLSVRARSAVLGLLVQRTTSAGAAACLVARAEGRDAAGRSVSCGGFGEA